jgi:hypothetical protein
MHETRSPGTAPLRPLVRARMQRNPEERLPRALPWYRGAGDVPPRPTEKLSGSGAAEHPCARSRIPPASVPRSAPHGAVPRGPVGALPDLQPPVDGWDRIHEPEFVLAFRRRPRSTPRLRATVSASVFLCMMGPGAEVRTWI